MKTPTKYVAPLTEEDTRQLEHLVRDDESSRVRCRARAVLLSARGFGLDQIARALDVTHRTASGWLDRWRTQGAAGLADAPRGGRPPTLTPQERERALELLRQPPHQPRQVLAQLEQETGKQISRSTLKRLARGAGLRWKRTRRTPAGEPDPETSELAVEHLATLEEAHAAEELDLYYLDATGFSLTPPVGYAWQPIGETLRIPSRKSARMNVLGLWSPTDDFAGWAYEGTLRAQDVAECLDAFRRGLVRETWVVLDNAPIHTAEAVWQHERAWASKGLHLLWLPIYSPELNPIERLWQQIKSQWLPLSVSDTFETLWDGVMDILSGVGRQYCLATD